MHSISTLLHWTINPSGFEKPFKFSNNTTVLEEALVYELSSRAYFYSTNRWKPNCSLRLNTCKVYFVRAHSFHAWPDDETIQTSFHIFHKCISSPLEPCDKSCDTLTSLWTATIYHSGDMVVVENEHDLCEMPVQWFLEPMVWYD